MNRGTSRLWIRSAISCGEPGIASFPQDAPKQGEVRFLIVHDEDAGADEVVRARGLRDPGSCS
jgi:hypothetical protein